MLTKIFLIPYFFGYALPITSTITVRVFLELLKHQIRQERQRQITNGLMGGLTSIHYLNRS